MTMSNCGKDERGQHPRPCFGILLVALSPVGLTHHSRHLQLLPNRLVALDWRSPQANPTVAPHSPTSLCFGLNTGVLWLWSKHPRVLWKRPCLLAPRGLVKEPMAMVIDRSGQTSTCPLQVKGTPWKEEKSIEWMFSFHLTRDTKL